MAATVMGNAAIALGGQEQHLCLPAIRTEGPAVAEYHRPSCAPVLVIDLRTVFRCNRAHSLPFLLSAEVVNLSCSSNGLAQRQPRDDKTHSTIRVSILARTQLIRKPRPEELAGRSPVMVAVTVSVARTHWLRPVLR